MWYHIDNKDAKNAGFGVKMMHRKRSQELQMTIEDFLLPFGGRLSAENHWVKLSKLMPWDIIEDIYAEKFKNENLTAHAPFLRGSRSVCCIFKR